MMKHNQLKKAIENGNTALGIELGSTRIKAVLIDDTHQPIASGGFDWENRYEDGVWTYHLEDAWAGLQACYRNLCEDVRERHHVQLKTVGAMGFSAMMHGYLAFDREGRLLVPFRTWRNTITGEASEKLTELFRFSIPQRWSVAHLYQAILNKERHVREVNHLTTLAGYVHWQLTGQKVLGVGEASGMFPLDPHTNHYDRRMLAQFNQILEEEAIPWRIEDVLPGVRVAGEDGGALTAIGAQLLDPSGTLAVGVPLCPPEGDAGTGMVATNSIAERTGNVSAGTSIFTMIVLEKPLSKPHPEIDIVTTPAGKPVAMVHTNNGTTDLNAWVGVFEEFSELLGVDIPQSRLFELLYQQALGGEADSGGLLAYNSLSGEHITHLEEGRPLFVRSPESRFTLANFMRVHLFSSLATMRIGLEILFEGEQVKVDQILGHGGFFKTPLVGQRMMAAATKVPISVMETAGEGGAWGMALLALYWLDRAENETLEAYLSGKVFAGESARTVTPDPEDVAGFEVFMTRYKAGLVIERKAVEVLN